MAAETINQKCVREQDIYLLQDYLIINKKGKFASIGE